MMVLETDCYRPDEVISSGSLVQYNDTKRNALAEYRCLVDGKPSGEVVTAKCLESGIWSYPSCQKAENGNIKTPCQ